MSVKQRSQTLKRSHNPFADSFYQLRVLNGEEMVGNTFEPFFGRLTEPLVPIYPEVLQVNLGKLCNQSCAHCHVDAGPDRKDEVMSRSTMEKILQVLAVHPIPAVDITGGAPEMNSNFRWFVEECRKLGKKVTNRCNLTIIVSHPKYRDLPVFFAQHDVHVVSSLPYFTRLRTDSQRGEGVFEDSIEALKLLNEVGYGKEGSGLNLDLVYNPSGAFLPGNQSSLEHEFKTQMLRRYSILFNRLYVITNLPISRFLDYLIESGNYKEYMAALVEAFNPATINGLMCRYTLSVGWDGRLYDCDFNQMLNLGVDSPSGHIDTFDLESLMARRIVVNQHCYGCTAGAGSSCGGEITA